MYLRLNSISIIRGQYAWSTGLTKIYHNKALFRRVQIVYLPPNEIAVSQVITIINDAVGLYINYAV